MRLTHPLHMTWRIICYPPSPPLPTLPHPRYDPRVVSDLDLPADLFRAQLVCEALNTCGAYYVRGQAKERLSRYLVYFQRYLLSKPLLPTHIEFAILDTFDNLEELARSAAIASAVKLKSAAPALKVLYSLSVISTMICYFLLLYLSFGISKHRLCCVRAVKLFYRWELWSTVPVLAQYFALPALQYVTWPIRPIYQFNIHRARTQPPHLLHLRLQQL